MLHLYSPGGARPLVARLAEVLTVPRFARLHIFEANLAEVDLENGPFGRHRFE